MAAVDAENILPSRRRRKKGRFIKQGYHRSEREDARRVAARTFLSSITLDSHLQRLHRSRDDISPPLYAPIHSVAGTHTGNYSDNILGPSATSANPITPPPRRLHELLLDTGSLNTSPLKVSPSKGHESTLNSPVPMNPFIGGRSMSYVESVIGDQPLWTAFTYAGTMSAMHEKRQFGHKRFGSFSASGPDASSLSVHCIPSLEQCGHVIGSNRYFISLYISTLLLVVLIFG